MNMIDIVACPAQIFDTQGVIAQWFSQHPDAVTVNSFSDIPQCRRGLFVEPEPIVVSVEKAPIAEIRSLVASETERDILVLTQHKVQGSIPNECSYTEIIPPTSSRDITQMLEKCCGIPRKHASDISRNHPGDALGALIYARQYSLAPEMNGAGVINPLTTDTPPWDITDAVCAGKPQEALAAVNTALASGVSPTSLFFQLCGYFTKVIAATEPSTARTLGGNARLFAKKARTCHASKLCSVISEYSGKIMSAGKLSDTVLRAFVIEASCCF